MMFSWGATQVVVYTKSKLPFMEICTRKKELYWKMATVGEEALLLEMTLKSKTWIWSWKSPVRCSCQKAERLCAAKTFRHSGEAVLPLTSFLVKHALTDCCRKETIKASPGLLNPECPSIYSILYTGWTVLLLNCAMHPTGCMLICSSIFTAFFLLSGFE